MSELTNRIQNVGIHACSDQTAITYIDAVNIREMMKQACIEAVRSSLNKNGEAYGYQVIEAIEGVD